MEIDPRQPWSPARPIQWPPLVVSAFRQVLGTALVFAVLWFFFAAPLALCWYGLSGLKRVSMSTPLVVFVTAFYEWHVPWSVWRFRLTDPDSLFRAALTAAAIALVGTPIAFQLAGDSGVEFFAFWAFLVAVSILLGTPVARLLRPTILILVFVAALTQLPRILGPAVVAGSWTLFDVCRASAVGGALLGAFGAFQDAFVGKASSGRDLQKDALGCAAALGALVLVVGLLLMALLPPARIHFVGVAVAGLGAAVGLPVGYWCGNALGRSAGKWVERRAVVLRFVWEYLRARAIALSALALGYVALALWFAICYQLSWRADPLAFRGLSATPSFPEFLYFSLVTLATIGYGDIVPLGGIARTLVAVEVLLGIGWTTVVVAAIVGISDRSLFVTEPGGDKSRKATQTGEEPDNNQMPRPRPDA